MKKIMRNNYLENALFEISFNPENSEEYEGVALIKKDEFTLGYTAFYNQARQTLSGEIVQIPASDLLNRLKADFGKKRNLDSEEHTQLLFLKVDAHDFKEAFEAMAFFAKVFTEKGKNYFS